MNDPYSVLGVSPSATDDEVKKAYRELVRKYHPDNYHDNPLADLAQEKMKEINEAYDTILKSREAGAGSRGQGGASGSYGGYTGYTRASGGSPEFNRIRTEINAGNLEYAEQLLNASQTRNAEWHFLMGSLCYRKGWLDDARRYFQIAVSMEPGNREYAQAMELINRGPAYSPYGFNYSPHAVGCSTCDICSAFICADLCCNCF
jgi:tetratricopeptide (TPR) repeat protein